MTCRSLTSDGQISIAIAHRYPHEGIAVIAAQAPDSPEVLAAEREQR